MRFIDGDGIPGRIIGEIEQNDFFPFTFGHDAFFKSVHVKAVAADHREWFKHRAIGVGKNQIVIFPVKVRDYDLAAFIGKQITGHWKPVGKGAGHDRKAYGRAFKRGVFLEKHLLPDRTYLRPAEAGRISENLPSLKMDLPCQGFQAHRGTIVFEGRADGSVYFFSGRLCGLR